MSAAASDLFMYVGDPGTATTLSAPGYTAGSSTSINVGSTANWPTATGVAFAMDEVATVNGTETQVPGSYREFVGTVASATSVSNISCVYGTDRDFSAGATTRVYIPISAERENRLVEGLVVSHKQDGTMIASLPLTTPKITTSLNDANGNEVIKTPATSSAVNEITVTNAATGNAPVISASGGDTNVDLNLRGKGTGKVTIGSAALALFPFNYIASGCVWSGDSYGSTRAGSMTSGVVVIGGKPLTVAAVTAHTFTASKDTYVDFQDNGDGTAKITYTEVTNNAASPSSLSDSSTFADSTHVRCAIIVTGASSIANAGSVNQGQEDKVLPIASNVAYSVTDSLGNLICPRDPQRKILGYKQAVSNQSTTSTSDVALTGLSVPVNIPAGRKVEITAGLGNPSNTGAGNSNILAIYETSTAGANLRTSFSVKSKANAGDLHEISHEYTPVSTSMTYVAAFHVDAGTVSTNAGSTTPAFIKVKLV